MQDLAAKNGSGTRPNLVVCSIMRDSMEYLDRYVSQVERYMQPGDRVVIVEGDSSDGTAEELRRLANEDDRFIVKHLETGGRARGSVVHEERFRIMAASMNLAWETALELNPERMLYLTADLHAPEDLVERLAEVRKPVVSPMITMADGLTFYDIWAFRHGNDPALVGPGGNVGCFQQAYPYHPVFDPDEPFQVETTGSVFLVDAEVLKAGVRFTSEEDVVGFCKQANGAGFEVWVHPQVMCMHDFDW